MTDEIISKCTLFFFLLTLDDKIATETTIKSIQELKRVQLQRVGASAFENSDLEPLIKICMKEWFHIRQRYKKEQIQIINTKALNWPEHIDLNPWKEFQKQAPENDLIAVTWVHVLGVSELTLARCLNLSEGTIRYRVGNGLSLLGQLNRPNISTLQFT